MADWGLYSALRGTDNWAQRRQDKMVNMQIVEKQAADEEKKTQLSMAAEENINQYLNAINDIDVLPEDQERIREVERNARQNIIQGIAANNGDLSRYVSSGGITDLNEYKNSIMQSGEVKRALSNKENMAKIITDKQQGNRWFGSIEVNMPQTENGEPVLDEDGNQILKPTKVTIDQQIGLYKRGIIDTISYNGSEKKIDVNAMTFKSAYRDHRNPSGPNEVTASDIMTHAMSKGASEQYAQHLAKTYVNRWKQTGQSWKWKAMSDLDRLEQETNVAYKMAALRKKTQTGQATMTENHWENLVSGADSQHTQSFIGEDSGKEYSTFATSTENRDDMLKTSGIDMAGIQKNKDDLTASGESKKDVEDMANKILLPNSIVKLPRSMTDVNIGSWDYTISDVSPYFVRVDGKTYAEVTIQTNEEALDAAGIRNETGFDYITGESKGLVKDIGNTGWGINLFNDETRRSYSSDNYTIRLLAEINNSLAIQKQKSKEFYSKTQNEFNIQGTQGEKNSQYTGYWGN